MESMPILHANQMFTILFDEDFTFAEVRAILDRLLDQNAFDGEVQQHQIEYYIDLDHSSFHVWVREMDVYIHRR
ncbi:MAG: hypothetical protein HY914_08300 [Desulfomonile tiedjei]|nr:hypothetical protein [Desulfomonile tiedjei]